MSEVGRDSREPRVQVFSAGGAYRRTIVPRPAGLPLARVVPLGELVLNDGRRVPDMLLPQHGARRRRRGGYGSHLIPKLRESTAPKPIRTG